ncbi:hypothetical protein HT031_000063 [Scenedesmus sp. PABB004]|nr:hypothetical protein HT031_000063 [Scenedesmus sp. PABB004]
MQCRERLRMAGALVLALALALARATASGLVATRLDCSTPGRVAGIACWLDDAGYVTGLALEDDYGVKQPPLCGAGGTPDGFIALHPDEVVTEVVACEGRAPGYSLLQFFTDGRPQPYECGFGLGAYDPALAVQLAAAARRAALSSGGAGAHALPSRAPGRCRSISSGKLPRWVRPSAADADKWFSDPAMHGPRYTVAGRSYDKAGSVDPATGRACSDCGPAGSYYYSQARQQQQRQRRGGACNAHTPGAGARPRGRDCRRRCQPTRARAGPPQVYPLAALEGSCAPDGRLLTLDAACWNASYRPAPGLLVLRATVQYGLCAGCERCPEPAAADRLRSLLAVLADRALAGVAAAKVKAGVIGCTPASAAPGAGAGANTSLAVAVTASLPPRDAGAARAALDAWLLGCAGNLCACLPVGESCAAQGVAGIYAEHVPHLPRGVRVEHPSEAVVAALPDVAAALALGGEADAGAGAAAPGAADAAAFAAVGGSAGGGGGGGGADQPQPGGAEQLRLLAM